MWWRFSKHRVALLSGIIVALIYVVALVPALLPPYPPDLVTARYLYALAQTFYVFATDGGFRIAPHVLVYRSVVVAAAGRLSFSIEETQLIAVGLFVKGAPYGLLGLLPLGRHLFGATESDQP